MSASNEIEKLMEKPNNNDKSCIKKLKKNLLEVSPGKLKNSLKKIGANLESSLEPKKDISFQTIIDAKSSNEIKEDIFVPSNKNDILIRLNIILNQESQSKEYKRRIFKIFKEIIQFIKIKKPDKMVSTVLNDGKNNDTIKRINISDVYNFIMANNRFKKESTKKYMLLRIRRYIRLLNGEEKLNYKQKILFKNNNNSIVKAKEQELIKILKFLRDYSTLQIQIIFYLLYFSGLNYSMVARITLNNFKQSFGILNMKKGKIILKRKFPTFIQNLLIDFFHNKNNKTKFFFYDVIKESKEIKRTSLVKNNITNTILNIKDISSNNLENILSDFSRLRKSKVLNEKYFYLFDRHLNIKKLTEENEPINPKDNILKNELIIINDKNLQLDEKKNFNQKDIKEDLFPEFSFIKNEDNFPFLSRDDSLDLLENNLLLDGKSQLEGLFN